MSMRKILDSIAGFKGFSDEGFQFSGLSDSEANPTSLRQLASTIQTPVVVSPAVYDAFQGSAHALFTTSAQMALFYPFDQHNIHMMQGNALKQNGMHPIQSLRQFWGKNPWAGVGYNFKNTLPRNMAVYTLLPELTDQLEEQGVQPMHAKIGSGLVAGFADALISSGYDFTKMAHVAARGAGKKLTPQQIKELFTPEELAMAKKYVGTLRFARSMWYFTTVPILADHFQQLLQNYNHMASTLGKDVNATIAGGAAGFVSLTGSQAMEVMKSRVALEIKMQILKQRAEAKATFADYSPIKPVLEAAKQTLKEEGAIEFLKQHPYKGFWAASTRMIAFSGLFQLTRELSKATTSQVLERSEHHDKGPTIGKKP
ncbi:MAG: MC/SLC25 family protein [Gammaproteobacteria bacterium]